MHWGSRRSLFRRIQTSTAPKPSTVAVGNYYEQLSLATLQRLAFELVRVGGRDDRGIDLLGHWKPPSTLQLESDVVNCNDPQKSGSITVTDDLTLRRSPPNRQARDKLATSIPAVVQCKAHASPPQPSWVRALEGSFAGAPSEWQGHDAIGVLVARGKATGGVRQSLLAANRGLMWVQLLQTDGEAQIGQILWNAHIDNVISQRLGTGLVYQTDSRGTLRGHMRLTVDGSVWDPVFQSSAGAAKANASEGVIIQ